MRTKHIASTLRRQRKRYGRSVTLKNPTHVKRDLRLGKTTQTYTSVSIKAVVLPDLEERDFVYDLSFIAANNNFTYGGLFEVERIYVIVDMATLTDFPISKETIVFLGTQAYKPWTLRREKSSDRYVIIRAQRLEDADLGRIGVLPDAASIAMDTQDPTVTP